MNETIKVCFGTCCQSRSAKEIADNIEKKQKIECVGCMGNCQNGPNIKQGEEMISQVTPQNALSKIERLKESKAHKQRKEENESLDDMLFGPTINL